MSSGYDKKAEGVLQKQVVLLERRVDLLLTELKQAQQSIYQANKQFEDAMSILKGMQSILLPTEWPYIPGFKIGAKYLAGMQGGDYYDIFGEPKSRGFHIWMSNCSSVSLSALMVSIVLKLTSQSLSEDIASFLQSIYKSLKEFLKDDQAVHFFCGYMHRRNLKLHFMLQGSINGFLYRDNVVHSLSKEASALSLTQGLSKPQILSLNAKDRLILFTPGLVEEKSKTGKSLDTDFIKKTLSQNLQTQDFINEVFYQLSLINEKEAFYDKSLILLDVKDNALRIL